MKKMIYNDNILQFWGIDMQDVEQTRDQLISELTTLRTRVKELEHCEAERIASEGAFNWSEQAFLDLFNATEEIAFLQETDGKILIANNNSTRFYKVSRESIVGKSIYDLIPPDRVENAREKVKAVLETKKTVRFEGTLGESVFENSLYPVFDQAGNVRHIAVYVRDITVRKRLEEAVHHAEEKYRIIYENAMEGIFQINPEGRFISANPALADIHGYASPEEMINSVTDIAHQLYVDPKDFTHLVKLLAQQDSVENYEAEMYRKDGGRHWIRIDVRIVRNGNGNVLYYEGTMLDISKRKKAEEQLRESEERYRIAIEHSNDGVAIVRGDRHEFVNSRFLEMFGYDSPEDLVGQQVFIIVHPDDLEKVMNINRRRHEGQPVPSRYEFKGITKDGRVIFVEVSAASISYRESLVYLIYLRDITERKEADQALWNERNRFQTLSDNAPFGIMVIDGSGNFTYLNPKFTELFGYDLHDVPNGMEWYTKAFPGIKEREAAISGWIKDVKNTKPGQRMARIFTITCKDGMKKSVNFIPVRLATGEYLVSLDDITERIQAQEALIQSHKELEKLNRAKTKAVNHISHELKTPLAVIQGNVRILKRKIQAASLDGGMQGIIIVLERNLERLFGISKETDEIFRVTQEVEANVLLDDLERLWERIEDLSYLPTDMHEHIEALKKWVGQYRAGSILSTQSIDLYPSILQVLEKAKQSARNRRIDFSIEGENDLFIMMDPVILREVAEGLIKNAIENTPDGGKIKISVEQKGDRIWLHVTDYGIGIREDNQQYLFDGLFHAKETDLYSSRRPYDFGAGGKGLELLRMKVYGQRFGFDITMKSKRCIYLPTDQDLCPGDVTRCPHISGAEGCYDSGGTTFSVSFPVEKQALQAQA
jgi:PAS domain S-box-containing protein